MPYMLILQPIKMPPANDAVLPGNFLEKYFSRKKKFFSRNSCNCMRSFPCLPRTPRRSRPSRSSPRKSPAMASAGCHRGLFSNKFIFINILIQEPLLPAVSGDSAAGARGDQNDRHIRASFLHTWVILRKKNVTPFSAEIIPLQLSIRNALCSRFPYKKDSLKASPGMFLLENNAHLISLEGLCAKRKKNRTVREKNVREENSRG